VESFRRWSKHEDILTETSRTSSGQVFDLGKAGNLKVYAMSHHEEAKKEVTAQFYVVNLPKVILGDGLLYVLSQILYGFRLLAIAIRRRPKYLIVMNGVTSWFMLAPLMWLGIKIVPVFNNGLWPCGYPLSKLTQRIQLALDGWFFRRIAFASLCVSPEIQRQIEAIAGFYGPIYQFRYQFHRRDFEKPLLPPPHGKRPFNIVFVGRVERFKGVFDLLEMAEQLRKDGVTFEICGGGPVLEELKKACRQRGLEDIVTLHGQLKRPQLLAVYARAHAVILPTRSNFCEGLPQVISEAILMGRPVITSRLSNTLDILGGAVVEVPPEDVGGYVQAIRRLLSDPEYYALLCKNCEPLREQFLDGKLGLGPVLQRALIDI
jgi:glycosyltransferase involved in cell wall biosynthesis